MSDKCLTIIVLLLIFIKRSFCQTGRFDPLPDEKECPATSKEWRRLEAARNCPDNAPYHCIKNQYQEFGEVCVRQSWVYSVQCPIYDTEHKQIDLKPCQPFDGYVCPTSEFLSNNVYKNEICLRTPKPTTTATVSPDAGKTTRSSTPAGPIAAVVLIIVVLGVALLVWFFYLRRRYNFQIPLPFTKRTITICSKRQRESYADPESQQLMLEGEKEIQRSNPYFVETRMYRDVISTLEDNNVALVVGKTGIGKSATCEGVLEYYRDRLEWKTKHLPTDIIEELEEKTIVLVDITFGDIPLYSRYDPKIETMFNRLYTLTRECRDFKVLITSSSPLTPENNIPILKGCAEFNFDNIQYEKEELKNVYERYTKRNINIENESGGKQDCKEDSSQNLSDSLRSRQSESGDSDTRKQMVGESHEENSQKEESVSTDEKNKEEKNNDTKSVPGKQEIEPTETSGTTPTENSTRENQPPIQEIGDVNQSRNGTAMSPSDVSLEFQVQTQMTDEERNGQKTPTEEEDETLKKANNSEFGLPAVCYHHRGFQEEVASSKTIDILSYLDSYVLSLAESNNKWERQRYSTLVYMMLNGSIISSGSIFKQLLGEIDPSLNPEQLLVCATEMVDEGMLQKRGKEHLFSRAAQIPDRLSTCPTKSSENGMTVTESVFSYSNDILLSVVIKSYVILNAQMFARYGYLPFIMQFLQPKEQSDRLSIQLRGDKAFLIELGTGFAKRNICENEVKDLQLLGEFKSKLNFHENATMKGFNIDKDKEDERKRNIFLRKMISHHPYLKEYYEYAEPEKFRSIPEDGFKQEVKKHLACCQSQKPNDF